MLVNINPIENGDAASPNLWNQRFGEITSAINGNIDSDNLKDAGVTTEKIAPGAVTSDKLDLDYYIDANGWKVFDFGPFKRYVWTESKLSTSVNYNQNISYPEGVTRNDVKEFSIYGFPVTDSDFSAGDWAKTWFGSQLKLDHIEAYLRMSDEGAMDYPPHVLQATIVA